MAGRTAALAYLLSGVVLNTVSQLITDTKFSHPNAHIVPTIKFAATLFWSAVRRPPRSRSAATAGQRRLMALIGLLDASAYCLYCLGFYACGATLANLLLSGLGQMLTAALTRFALRRHLTRGQLTGIACVALGLAVRVVPSSALGGGSAAGGAGGAPSPEQLWGGACVALAALLYSLLGVAYEHLLRGPPPPPPNAEIMWHVSILGFLASATYQALYTWPNRQRLLAEPLAASTASPGRIAALLALFGGLFNGHMLVQAAVFKSEGAIGVGLVNAVRGAVITVVIAALFCTPQRRHLCLTPQTVLSAAITTVGGAVYVLAGGGRPPGKPAAETAAGRGSTVGTAASGAEGRQAAAKKDE